MARAMMIRKRRHQRFVLFMRILISLKYQNNLLFQLQTAATTVQAAVKLNKGKGEEKSSFMSADKNMPGLANLLKSKKKDSDSEDEGDWD